MSKSQDKRIAMQKGQSRPDPICKRNQEMIADSIIVGMESNPDAETYVEARFSKPWIALDGGLRMNVIIGIRAYMVQVREMA